MPWAVFESVTPAFKAKDSPFNIPGVSDFRVLLLTDQLSHTKSFKLVRPNVKFYTLRTWQSKSCTNVYSIWLIVSNVIRKRQIGYFTTKFV